MQTHRIAFLVVAAAIFGAVSSAGAQSNNLNGYWDPRFGPEDTGGMGANSFIRSVAIHPITGDVYAGGSLTNAGGVRTTRIGRWTGTEWLPLGQGLGNGVVEALAFTPDGVLYVGGNFNAVVQSDGTRLETGNIARWDGNVWSPVGSGVDENVWGLAYDEAGGNVYAVGEFEECFNADSSSTGSRKAAYWDGASWQPMGLGVTGGGRTDNVAVDPSSGLVVVGGRFTASVLNADSSEVDANGLAFWDGDSWSSPNDVPNFLSIDALVFDEQGRLYAGGTFSAVGDLQVDGLARYDGASWSSLGGEVANGTVDVIVVDDGGAFVGGDFDAVKQPDGSIEPMQRIGYIDFSTGEWSSLDDGARAQHFPGVYSMALNDGELFVGGRFDVTGGRPTLSFGRWIMGDHAFSTTPVRFDVDMRAGRPFGLERQDQWTPRPILEVLNGNLAGLYYTFDNDGDGIHSITIDLPAGEVVDYVFLVDQNGNSIAENGFVYELDPPEEVREFLVPAAGATATAPLALYDDHDPSAAPGEFVQQVDVWLSEDRSGSLLLGGEAYRNFYDVVAADRDFFLSAFQSNTDPGGAPPDGIARVANNVLWRFEVWPTSAVYSVTLEWEYQEITGIANPDEIRLLHRDGPDSAWTVVPTEVDVNDEILITRDISSLSGEWTIGSTSPDNVLTSLLPGIAANPRPGDGVLNAPINPILRWDPVDEASSYQIYLWRSSDGPPGNPTGQSSQPEFAPGPLENATLYSWRVMSININGTTEGPEWTFRVGQVPDLVVSDVQSPTSVMSGQDVEIIWTTANAGDGGTNVPRWNDGIFISESPDFDPETAALLEGIDNLAALNPGEEYTNRATVTLPRGLQGGHYIHVVADIATRGLAGVDESDESNNVTASAVVDVALEPFADLEVADVVASDAVFSGDSIDVTWTVNNVGTGQTDRDSWFDTIFISSDDTLFYIFAIGGTELNIREDPVASFEHTGALEAGESYTVTHRIKLPEERIEDSFLFVFADIRGGAKQPADGDVYEFNQGLDNWTSEPIGITLTPPPDLVVTEVTGPAAASSGQSVEVSWTVENQGPGATRSDVWQDQVFYSPSDNFDEAVATPLSVVRHEGVLGPNESYEASTVVRVPDGASGDGFFFVDVDQGSEVFEHTFAGNNVGSPSNASSVTLSPYPDLQIVGLRTNATSTQAGATIPVVYRLENRGSAAAEQAWVDSVYVSNEAAWNPFAVIPVAASRWNAVLEPGGSMERTVAIAIPPVVEGTFYVFIKADADESVFEHPDEANNIRRTSPLSASGYPPIDLAASIASVPDAASSGEVIPVELVVANRGAGKTLADGWIDAVFISDDEEWSADDVRVAAFNHEGRLDGLTEYRYERDIRLPDTETGSVFVLFRTDTAAIGLETTVANNLAVAPIEVALTPPADLVVTDIAVSDSIFSSQSLRLTWTIQNSGDGPTPGDRWFDEAYLSTDRLLDRNDVLLGTFEHTSGLAAGQSRDGTAQVRVPPYASGPFYVLVDTDARDEIYEHNADGNNVGTQIVELTLAEPSDLVVASVTAPASAMSGEPVDIEWTIRNEGENPARGLLRDAVFVSADEAWSPDDLLLGVSEYEIDLDPGSTAEVAMKVDVGRSFAVDAQGRITTELPGLLPGSYFAIVRTDIGNSIRETDVENNDGVSDGSVETEIPTLALSTPTAVSLEEGESRFFRLELQDAADLRLSLTSDKPASGNELYVAHDRPPVAGGDFDFGAFEGFVADQQMIVPSAAAGTHFVLAVARSILPDNSENVTLLAEALGFEIIAAFPDVCGQGPVTTTILGSGFRESTSVFLDNGQGARIEGSVVEFVSTTELIVRWDLTAAPLGQFDLVAINDQIETTLEGGVEIEESRGLIFEEDVIAPEASRAGGRSELVFDYRNTTNVDIPYLDVEFQTTGTPEARLDVFGAFMKPGDLFAPEGETGSDFLEADGIRIFQVIAVNLPPGQSARARIVSQNTPAGPLGYSSDALALTSEEYVDGIIQDLEEERAFILANARSHDAQVVALAGDRDAFMTERLQEYVDAGLLAEIPATATLAKTLAFAGPSGPADLVAASGTQEDQPKECKAGASQCCQATFCKNTSLEYCVCRKGIPPHCYEANNPDNESLGCQWKKARCAQKHGESVFFPPDKCGCTNVRVACDPNDILGPDGWGPEQWVSSVQPLPYTIRFENDAQQASAPAQVVSISHPLDASVDERNFRLGSFGFGPFQFDPPDNVSYYRTKLDVADSLGVIVDVTAGIDVIGKEAFWILTSLDPITGDQPVNDPFVGFLPVNDDSGIGEGFVSYTIQASPDAVTGDVIDAEAEIVFDINAPIATPPIFNTVDATPPVSTLNVLAGRQDSTTFEITWRGNDDGAGIRHFDLYTSVNGGPFEAVETAVTDTSTLFIGTLGNRYRFYTLATDNSGNVEADKNGGPGTTVSVEEDQPAGIPKEFALHQNYPNPFNPSTTIPFDLPQSGQVQLILYDILGRQVLTIDKGDLRPGAYQHLLNMSDYASGVYLYQILVKDGAAMRFADVGKLVLVK